MKQPITKKQKEVLAFIKGFSKKEGYPPSLKEISKSLGFTSHSTAQFHVNQLVEKGYLKKESGKARTIEPLSKSRAYIELPILGTVTAGGPIEALEEQSPDLLKVPKELIGNDMTRHYILRVKGDSMVEKHVLPGDLVIIREQSHFDNGDIVVIADEDWNVTLKEVLCSDKRVTVKPANKKYQTYELELGKCQVVGKMVGLMRLDK